MLPAPAQEHAASRCPLELMLLHLTSPRLRVADVGGDFAPGRDALRQAVERAIEDEAAVYDVLVLLFLTFRAVEDEETITFDCNQRILGDGKRALHLAAERGGPLSLLLLLLVAGAEVNPADNEWKTPLLSAAIAGSGAACKVLLEHGAEVNAQDKNRGGPLHWAAKKGQPEVAQVLLAGGANPNLHDNVGRTPLDYAEKEEVKAALREHGGKHSLIYAAEKGMREEVAVLIKGGSDVNRQNGFGRTPLHLAASQGRLEVAKALLAANADVHVRDSYGYTPLKWAQEENKLQLVELLQQHGAMADDSDLSPSGEEEEEEEEEGYLSTEWLSE